MKLDPLDFEGTLNSDAYLEWIQTLESLFDVKGHSDEKSFKVAIPKLKKYTSFQYENTKRQRAKGGKLWITTSFKLKKFMHRRLMPEGYKRDL